VIKDPDYKKSYIRMRRESRRGVMFRFRQSMLNHRRGKIKQKARAGFKREWWSKTYKFSR